MHPCVQEIARQREGNLRLTDTEGIAAMTEPITRHQDSRRKR
jgi:hypothetical protein